MHWAKKGSEFAGVRFPQVVSQFFCGHCCSSYLTVNKCNLSRICRFLFVNATFKVGPSSPAQNTRASGGPTCLRFGNWSLRFYRVLHLTACALLLAWGYTPLPKGWCPGRHRHTLLVGHKWWLRGIIFVWVYTLFFRKILLVIPLRTILRYLYFTWVLPFYATFASTQF